MSFPFGITVTVEQRSQDRYGQRTTTTTATVAGCGFAPGASSEALDKRDQVAEEGNLYAPPGTVINPTDRVVLPDNTVWEVTGTASSWQSPWTGWTPGVVVPLKRVTG